MYELLSYKFYIRPSLNIGLSMQNITMTFLWDIDIICSLDNILPYIYVNNLLFNINKSWIDIMRSLIVKCGNEFLLISNN